MKNFWNNNKEFRVFAWTVFNVVVAFALSQLANLDGTMAIISVGLAVPFLNAFTKYANKKRFGDLGVSK